MYNLDGPIYGSTNEQEDGMYPVSRVISVHRRARARLHRRFAEYGRFHKLTIEATRLSISIGRIVEVIE